MTFAWSELEHLRVYRNLLSDPLLATLGSEAADAEKTSQLIRAAEEHSLEGDVVVEYLLHLIAEDENAFSLMSEKSGGHIGDSLTQAVMHDVNILKNFFCTGAGHKIAGGLFRNYSPTRKRIRQEMVPLRDVLCDCSTTYSPEDAVAFLTDHYVRHGYGDMARYSVFRWDAETGLIPVKHPDRIRMDDLIGYERQKAVLTQNTESFLAGKPANNVLLVGSRGTGKSSAVKSLTNHYADKGLRLVEITKHDLRQLPDILLALRERSKKFVLFMDDLSFEEFEIEYRHLKSMMEGGVETKPDNVLIYATSNRRHLVKETWSDRAGANSEDLHSWDTLNEKISLSDRFGITLSFAPPNQDEYLRIVESIAKKKNLGLTNSELRAEAIKWEMSHSGRSGRSAQQLVAHLAG